MKRLLLEKQRLNGECKSLLVQHKAEAEASRRSRFYDDAVQVFRRIHAIERLLRRQREELSRMLTYLIEMIPIASRRHSNQDLDSLIQVCTYVATQLYSDEGIDLSTLRELFGKLSIEKETPLKYLEEIEKIEAEALSGKHTVQNGL